MAMNAAQPSQAGSLERLLAEQHLTLADLQENRAGRVSRKQADEVARRRRFGARFVTLLCGGGFLVALAFASYDFASKHQSAVFVLPTIAAALWLVLSLVYFKVMSFPADISQCRVVPVDGEIHGLLVAVQRDAYSMALHGVLYAGLSGRVTVSRGFKLRAWTIREHKLILSFEPLG